MSDYNDFYQIHEKRKFELLSLKLDNYADEIILSIQNDSKLTSPAKSSQHTSQLLIETENRHESMKTEPTPTAENNDMYDKDKDKKKERKKKEPKSK